MDSKGASSDDQQLYPLQDVKQTIADLVVQAVQAVYSVDVKDMHTVLFKSMKKPRHGQGDLGCPCFPLGKKTGVRNPKQLSASLYEDLKTRIVSTEAVSAVFAAGPFLNFTISTAYLGSIISAITKQGFLDARPPTLEKVMIEYSQPNTHKAFHVGHMRNAALGDSIVRLYEQVGYPVTAVNYFGDEGAHIAKCLWLLQKEIKNGSVDMKGVKPELRGEFLGLRYSKAVENLDISTLTTYPYPGVYAAKVINKTNHPDPTAPANWHLVTVVLANDEKKQVVCGGKHYEIDDLVAYVPVGGKYKGHDVIEKDMKGVTSCGVIMGRAELGLPDTDPNRPEKKEEKEEEKKEEKKDDQKQSKKKKKKKKGKKGGKTKVSNIFVLPADVPVGSHLPEYGAIKASVPTGSGVMEEFKARQDAVRALLRAMEEGEPEITALWQETKQWSLTEFKRIYTWLNCRFDHDFFESEVGAESRQLVIDWKDRGLLKVQNGAIVADLTQYKLDHLVLLKSNGAGLYATKDLTLAVRKFDQFNIDTSIYVVDASQTHHFKQVFKVLSLMGYEQASKCFHLPYGLVTIPSGKMSSRKGTVILFSQLADALETKFQGILSEFEGKWPAEEIEQAVRHLSVATIKYGMLNHDTAKDVVFELGEWSAATGNTGPYMMYAFARVRAIFRNVPVPDVEADLKLLADTEKGILMQLAGFWVVVDSCVAKKNPSGLCAYLFQLAKAFASWYEKVSIKKESNLARQAVLLQFVDAIARTIQTGMRLLGITTIERM